MNTLVKAVAVVFTLVSLLAWARWLQPADVTGSTELEATDSLPREGHRGEAREEAPMKRPGATLGERERHESASQPPATDSVNAETLEELRLGLAVGFTREEALALARQVELEVLAAFFEAHSHISPDWLHRSGLPPEHLRPLYARWAAGSDRKAWELAPGDVLLSRYSPRHDGGPYRIQNGFQSEDRTVYLHYTVPQDYSAASVVIRWVHEGGSGLSHFDYHPVTTGPGQRQEAWVRPKSGWEPGTYRVEIFGTNEALPLLAARTYTVVQ
ncbi:hypothetical protein [Marinimicrobium agarilyticum]|uniref:hypothetical protein n=1 Tax=Marinimicrobium agarilyticum TaxID=306546 RepID=UPI00040D5C25|nr:hypothetical protein [Marinimicrobium agarilyticum]